MLAAEGLVELVPRRGCRVIELSRATTPTPVPGDGAARGPLRVRGVAQGQRRRPASCASCTSGSSATPRRTTSTATTAPTTPSTAACRRWPTTAGSTASPTTCAASCACCAAASSTCPGRIDASINEHRVLIDAIEQRDAARAERAMHDHLMAQLVALKALRQHERTARRQRPQAAHVLEELRDAARRASGERACASCWSTAGACCRSAARPTAWRIARHRGRALRRADRRPAAAASSTAWPATSAPTRSAVLRSGAGLREAARAPRPDPPDARGRAAAPGAAAAPEPRAGRHRRASCDCAARCSTACRSSPQLAGVEADLLHLLSSWFNPGFLRDAAGRLELAGATARADHPPRGGARRSTAGTTCAAACSPTAAASPSSTRSCPTSR